MRPLKQIRIEVTKRCNLKCDYCYNQGAQSESELNYKIIMDLVAQAAAMNVKTISFTGGEPFLRFELLSKVIPEIVGLGMKCGIITNGTLIDDDIADKLESTKVSWVRFSIEGHDQNEHEIEMCRGDSFSKIVKSMVLLKKRGINIKVRTTVSKANYENLDGIFAFCEKMGVEEIRLQPYFFVNNKEVDSKYLITPEEHKMALIELRRLRAASKMKAILDYGWFDFLFPGYDEKYPYVVSPCGRTFLFIDSDGNLQSCGPMKEKAGNIRDRSFDLANIWNNSPAFRSYDEYDPGGICDICGNTELCKGGCPAKIYNLYGDMDHPQPMCPLVREYSYRLVVPQGYNIKNG
jgi:radical SAM protein with 4Fe4S-binding SPASM domain